MGRGLKTPGLGVHFLVEFQFQSHSVSALISPQADGLDAAAAAFSFCSFIHTAQVSHPGFPACRCTFPQRNCSDPLPRSKFWGCRCLAWWILRSSPASTLLWEHKPSNYGMVKLTLQQGL
eukprot:4662950-Pyramimonas_sp.AAC.1